MGNRRRYHRLVAEDIREAVEYYDAISLTLGNRFRASVRRQISKVTRSPDSFGRIHEQI